MSFLKIKDPSKRDALVAEFLKIKNEIQNDFRSERLGEQSLYEDFGKIFKPITEQQQKLSEEIVSKFAPLQEAIENIPPALPWGQEHEGHHEALPVAPAETPLPINIDLIARKYLVNSYGTAGDKTFRFDNRGGEFFLGNTEVDFEGNDLVIGGKRFSGMRGLWDLIIMKRPVVGLATEEDKKNYEKSMVETGAIRNRRNPQKPAANKGYKWENFIRPILDKYVQKPKQKATRQQKKNTNTRNFGTRLSPPRPKRLV